ncbi:MAG TPA: TonB-dependent receptor [Allosphingosinicella sp.]|nr:TonB-dependent receptor [Allosphingosinicella sp.]
MLDVTPAAEDIAASGGLSLKRNHMMRKRCPALGAGAVLLALPFPALAQTPSQDSETVEALRDLSIEELSRIEVSSASKQAEPIGRAPTSIFVITGSDIVRSAATSLPEALRLAPNLQVQQLDARQFAITSRGFNGAESSNKLLVLIDGRSVYSTLNSGVFWELHSPLLEDVRQIEVISGPGGTLYGPNAVNGIVSVATRDSRETLGGLVRATAGPSERTLALRYGAVLGKAGAVRVYANGLDREEMPAGPAPDSDDGITGWQAGFRADFGGETDHVTVQGDIFDTDVDLLPGDGDRGHNLLARWTHGLGGKDKLQVQAYYDDYRRRFILVRDSLETFDLEAQLNAHRGSHEIVLGGGIRTTRDEFINDLNGFKLAPQSRRLWILNAFAQDRMALTPKLDLVAGLKLERSTFSGVQLLPNLRLAWRPSDRATLWGAVSRAVRTPSRIDRQLVFLPLLAEATNFQSEKLIAFEAGYRGRPGASTTLSVSLFYNLYDDIRTTEFTGDPLPIRLQNGLKGHSYGAEAWLNHRLSSRWRASLGIAAMAKDFHLKDGAVDLADRASLGADPDYQVVARSQIDLTDRIQLDVGLRGVDDLGASGLGGYVEADARLAWRVSDPIELYVAGNNLLHGSHVESDDVQRAQRIRRSVYLGTRLRF